MDRVIAQASFTDLQGAGLESKRVTQFAACRGEREMTNRTGQTPKYDILSMPQ